MLRISYLGTRYFILEKSALISHFRRHEVQLFLLVVVLISRLSSQFDQLRWCSYSELRPILLGYHGMRISRYEMVQSIAVHSNLR